MCIHSSLSKLIAANKAWWPLYEKQANAKDSALLTEYSSLCSTRDLVEKYIVWKGSIYHDASSCKNLSVICISQQCSDQFRIG